MKITICLSILFYPEMLAIKEALENSGHEVLVPPSEVADGEGKMIPVAEYYKLRHADEDWVWERKKEAMRWHFDKVAAANAVLILNFDKHGIKNYIGANTLLEMGLAFHLGKPIYLWNPIPEGMSYLEEIKGMMPVVINNDLSKIPTGSL